jgi:hypothetical protein
MLATDHPPTATLQQKGEAYAEDAFGVTLALEPIQPPSLPFYIVDRYRLWRGDLFGRACLFMAPDPNEIHKGLGEVARHRATVCNQLHADLVVLLFEALPPRQRRKLVADRIAFMVPGAQLYVPELFLEFREGRVSKPPITRAPDRLSPTAQMVTIAALLDRQVEDKNATALARTLGVAAMSMIRAFDELQAAGIADTHRVGRERTLYLNTKGRDLWTRVEPLLQSPVRKVRHVFIPYPDRFPGVIAGESALANYTALASPRIQTQAVAGADWNRLVREHALIDKPDHGEGEDIQTWAYDPAVFAERMTVDRVSLYLSMRDHADERVAQAAEQLLEGMPW